MTAHTPGTWDIDWYICKTGNGEQWRVPTSIGPISPYHSHWAGWHLDVEESDAYLIAAAPDLLEALEKLIADLKISSDLAKRGYRILKVSDGVLMCAEKAIAKAKGEL